MRQTCQNVGSTFWETRSNVEQQLGGQQQGGGETILIGKSEVVCLMVSGIAWCYRARQPLATRPEAADKEGAQHNQQRQGIGHWHGDRLGAGALTTASEASGRRVTGLREMRRCSERGAPGGRRARSRRGVVIFTALLVRWPREGKQQGRGELGGR